MSVGKSNERPETFEQSFAALEEIVERLERGTLGLEDALAEFEKGVGLLRDCSRVLDEAERRIEILLDFDADGHPRTRPFDAAATQLATDAVPVQDAESVESIGSDDAAPVEPDLGAPEPGEPERAEPGSGKAHPGEPGPAERSGHRDLFG